MSVDYPILESDDFTPFQTQHNHFARRSYSLSDLHGRTLSSLISQRVPLLPWPLDGFASQANAIPKIDFSNYQFDGYLPRPSFHLLTDQRTTLFQYPIQASAFSQAEFLGLFDKATQFVGDSMRPFTYYYRDKPKAYWTDASKHDGSIMKTYRKDFNGHTASPINGRINGLFFSCRTQPDGSLPESSVFGDIRLILNAAQVPLDPWNTRLYFADFYCNSSAKGQFGCGMHYVTIVVTRPFTEVDEFCKHSLLQLDPGNNCFLQIQPNHSRHYYGWEYSVNCNPHVWVEVFLTQDVDTRFAYFRDVKSTGQSQPNGVSNNRFCSACNLLPQEPSLAEAQSIAAGGRVHNGVIEPHRRASGKRKATAEHHKVPKKWKLDHFQTPEAKRHCQSSVSRKPTKKTETFSSSAPEAFAGLRGTELTATRGRAKLKRIKRRFIQLIRQAKHKLRRGLAGI